MESKITINVGGKLFQTCKSTLLKARSSYFDLLSSGRWLPDVDNHYFIDRDPLCFGVILNYLRTGKLDARDLSNYEKEKLLEDLDYYKISDIDDTNQMEKLKRECFHWLLDENKKEPSIHVTQNCRVAYMKTNGKGSVLGSVGMKSGKYVWKARIITNKKPGESTSLYAGICKEMEMFQSSFRIPLTKTYCVFPSSVGEVITFTLDLKNLIFQITGSPLIKPMKMRIAKDCEYYPFFSIDINQNTFTAWELLEASPPDNNVESIEIGAGFEDCGVIEDSEEDVVFNLFDQ
eukprot:TRINITY_DN9208_c0_g1_i1.p1 TRINITY_DN9208_c0_g1~~TRINITY_DN9208_c0_g1_i1.p1  ORF type:complete len:305 (+),score=38.36 TRINITY_DN9208_c0_g1_i1:46-915(+)